MINKALLYAENQHRNQKRDGGQPYFIHLYRVYRTVENYTQDSNVLCASLLHDTVEDTGTTLEFLKENFGSEVADLVHQLTNDYSDHLEHSLKLVAIATHAKHIVSPGAKLIKLADRLDNLRDYYHWKIQRQLRYREQTIVLLDNLGDLSEYSELVMVIGHECNKIITRSTA